ncbi:MAG TPA: hypothetical protein VLS90_02710 [Thermodesulfobacteriota bacterium]|nr:hypothetical protein [Thermodesulfobacteriota bacterium]
MSLEKKGMPGICDSCRNAEECTFPRDAAKPVNQCEEFSGMECGLERHSCEGALPRTGLVPQEDSSAWFGLCRNCDNRNACTFPRHEGGVWHCDEYV